MGAMFIGGLFGALEAPVGDGCRFETLVLSGQRYWPLSGAVVGGWPAGVDAIYTWEALASETDLVRLVFVPSPG